MKKVGIVMGSDSDLPVIQKATDLLKALQIPLRSMSTPPTAPRWRRTISRQMPGMRASA